MLINKRSTETNVSLRTVLKITELDIISKYTIVKVPDFQEKFIILLVDGYSSKSTNIEYNKCSLH